MKLSKLMLSAFLLIVSIAKTDACTSLIVGKKASVDGSVIVSYSADSHVLYGELYHWPARTWDAKETLDIYEWDTGKFLGKIPQAKQTYSVVGNMNEHQLTIVESTWGGRPELVNPKGIIDYGSLIYVTLQRARTAQEAIKVMTTLVAEHGYYSSGESFTIADPNEAWIMEMIGKGAGNKGAVWVAVRIPDDAIAAHANHSRIHTFPLNDKTNCIYSPDVISFARDKGYFSGNNKDFSFSEAYCPIDETALRACEARVWAYYRKFQPEAEQYLSYIKGLDKKTMPISIKPANKLSVQDVKEMMRDHFEGTEFDMTNDPGAGPYKSPYRWRPLTYQVDSTTYTNERAIATQQTGFSLVAQMRSWLPSSYGGILWFGVDDAATSIYTPIYCGTQKIPYCYAVGNGSLNEFSWDSFFWINNWVANMAYSKYSFMIQDLKPVMHEVESYFNNTIEASDRYLEQLYSLDRNAADEYVSNQSVALAEYAFSRWKKMGEFLMVRYIDGNVKKVKDGKILMTPDGGVESPDQPGYDEHYYRTIVKDAGERLKVK